MLKNLYPRMYQWTLPPLYTVVLIRRDSKGIVYLSYTMCGGWDDECNISNSLLIVEAERDVEASSTSLL